MVVSSRARPAAVACCLPRFLWGCMGGREGKCVCVVGRGQLITRWGFFLEGRRWLRRAVCCVGWARDGWTGASPGSRVPLYPVNTV